MRICGLIVLVLLSGQAEAALAAEHRLTVPFTEKLNAQPSNHDYNPRHHYNPFIRIRLKNPQTGREQDVAAVLDTGSDNCVIGEDVAAALGLETAGAELFEIRTGAGPIRVPFVKIAYRLRDDQGTIVDSFPQQTTHCLVIKEPRLPVIMGFIGFVDRFKRITLKYPTDVELVW